MSSLVPIGAFARTPHSEIAAEASSEISVSDAACNKKGQAKNVKQPPSSMMSYILNNLQ